MEEVLSNYLSKHSYQRDMWLLTVLVDAVSNPKQDRTRPDLLVTDGIRVHPF